MSRLLATAAALVVVALCCLSPTADANPAFKKNFDRYVPPFHKEKRLDLVDKLYKRLDDMQCKVKTAKEQLEALEAQVGMLKRTLREIVLITLERLKYRDVQQAIATNILRQEIQNANDNLDGLCDCLQNATDLNDQNLEDRTILMHELVNLEERDCRQNGRLAELSVSVADLKEKLLQVCGNALMMFDDRLKDEDTKLEKIRQCESKRICESAIVTLDRDDRRAEYQFQNYFSSIPEVFFGISFYRFLLDTRRTPAHSYGYVPWVEPNSLGVFVMAIPSRTGVTFEKFNLAFGDTRNQKITVSFQACSIGAGLESTHGPSNAT